MPAGFDLDQIKMNVVKTAGSGVVNHETIFKFHQADDLVWADYSGGPIVRGHLIGKMDGESLTFRYCQIDKTGNLDGGISNCDIDRKASGKLRMIERFLWESRNETGENVFEEL